MKVIVILSFTWYILSLYTQYIRPNVHGSHVTCITTFELYEGHRCHFVAMVDYSLLYLTFDLHEGHHHHHKLASGILLTKFGNHST